MNEMERPEASEISSMPENFYEQHRGRQLIQLSRQTFAKRVEPVNLEMIFARDPNASYLERTFILTERTAEDLPYHYLWNISVPPESNRDTLPFWMYFELCRNETARVHNDSALAEGYTLAVFTERFQEELNAESTGVLAKFSGSRTHPIDDETHRTMFLHIIATSGIVVFELQYQFIQKESAFFDTVPYRYCSADKLFALREPHTTTFYALPEGWEGLKGQMSV